MGKKAEQPRKGVFDHDTLTVAFGGEFSKPENIFTAYAMKVPEYTETFWEREDAGGGAYYSNRVQVDYKRDNDYLIFHNGECIGWMRPYHRVHGSIKSSLFPLAGCNPNIIAFLIKIQQDNGL